MRPLFHRNESGRAGFGPRRDKLLASTGAALPLPELRFFLNFYGNV
jgi:hypothetical protein